MPLFNGFICDKCGKEFRADSTDYYPVALQVRISLGQSKVTSSSKNKQAVWCRECVMKTGIQEPITEEDKKIAPPELISFEDTFVNLLEDLGFTRESY